jgi:hypothetical protein
MADKDLSPELIEAGAAILAKTDELAMQAQGAMWVFDSSLEDWRYYLVTTLVDTLGRRKTYKLLIDAFEKLKLPQSMIVDDVHLGSPTDPFFQLISSMVNVSSGSVSFRNCSFNGVKFDGRVYRSISTIPAPDEAEQINKRFSKRVRDLIKAA